ncbi:MAG: hypothetical protein Q7T81_15995 [Pseudolabrys sp.]|nr:hypothetical protein [Pseudolabrys sp.]
MPVESKENLNLLLLCDFNDRTASTIVDHIEGLRNYSKHKIWILSSRGELPQNLDLRRFDGIIIHYSLVACLNSFIGPKARAAIRGFKGIKVAFVQDDYRFIDMTVAALSYLGVDVLFGLAGPDIIDQVYSPTKLPGVLRETVLAGYVPVHLTKQNVPPFADRPIDIGYRARKLPAWLGSHGKEKWVIAERVIADAARFNLRCDISTNESDRIYGDDWIGFVTSCKAMLGSESGSGVCDFTGRIQLKVESHVAKHPTATFEELRELYFKEDDGRVMMNVISPRCFEAAALRTLMILYEGYYSGRLIAWRHYLPLKRDHSNMDEVVAILRNPAEAQKIIDAAYSEVALNPENLFEAMVQKMDVAVGKRFAPRMLASKPAYDEKQFFAVREVARQKQHRREVLHRIVSGLLPYVQAGLALLPAGIRAWLHSKLRGVWWLLLGVETPGMRRIKTFRRLVGSSGLGAAFKTMSMCRLHPGFLEADVSDLAQLLASGEPRIRIYLDDVSNSLEICFGAGVPAGRRIESSALRKALRTNSVRHIFWRAEAIEVVGMLGMSSGSFQDLANLAETDSDIVADLFDQLLFRPEPNVLRSQVSGN